MPVDIPSGVDLKIDDRLVTAKGKLGELSLTLVDDVELVREDDKLIVSPRNESKRARAMWGTSRSLLANIIHGVDQGFTINLEIQGVGYRAAVEGKELVLQLGYSHEIRYPMPDGITIASERPTHIAVSGADRQQVGQVAAQIRAFRKPEPYKGKGIRYENEYVIRKEGKKK
jgi:large subunit ribosomal protein L6